MREGGGGGVLIIFKLTSTASTGLYIGRDFENVDTSVHEIAPFLGKV